MADNLQILCTPSEFEGRWNGGYKMKRVFYRTAHFLKLFTFIQLLSAPLQAATPEKINASYGAISGSMAPIWVAKEARLFDKQGLDLNLVYIPGGPRSIMSLIGGSVQFVNHSGMPALEAYQRGADTALIASSMNQLEHAVVAQKSITNVEQLRGKILGISAIGSLTDILMREGLRLNGISEKDVTIAPVGDEGGRLNALYEQQKERLSTKPTPYVRVVKSMMYLLSRTRPEVPSASPEGFAEARFINELESVGFFDEMNRQYGK